MAAPETRGNCLASTYAYILTRYQGEQQKRIIDQVGPEIIGAYKTAGDKDWFPSSYFSAGLHAIADASADDLARAQAEVMGVGKHIASCSVAGFMRLLMRMMTPRILAQKLPDIFARDFRNTKAYVTVGVHELAHNRMHCHFLEMSELPYVPCAAQGWLAMGLESMGCKNLKFEGLDPDWNCNDGTFIVSWS